MYDMLIHDIIFSKYVGVVEISDPVAVKAKLSSLGDVYENGAVFCSCPEKDMTGVNLIYCRYGLSIPYYKVKDGDKLWIQPTIGETERWVYDGFVDCGRDSVDPSDGTHQAIFENESGIFKIIVATDYIIEIDSASQTTTIEDGTNTFLIDKGNSKVQINGTNLEVLV